MSSDEDENDIEFGVLNKDGHSNYLRKALFDLSNWYSLFLEKIISLLLASLLEIVLKWWNI